jgi:hypothetical protein
VIRFLINAVLLLVFAVPGDAPCGEKDSPKKKAEKGGPVELRVVVNKASYELDLGGKTPKQFRKMLDEAARVLKGPAEIPPAPEVALALEIHNPTDQEQTAFVGGDFLLKLQLKGPGAVCLRYNASYTTDVKRPEEVKLAAGKSHRIPLKRLEHGFRGYGERCYWTEPGEYTLTVSYGTRSAEGKAIDLTAPPVKLQVKRRK